MEKPLSGCPLILLKSYAVHQWQVHVIARAHPNGVPVKTGGRSSFRVLACTMLSRTGMACTTTCVRSLRRRAADLTGASGLSRPVQLARAFSVSAVKNKEKLVILGSGWGGYEMLRGIDKKRWGELGMRTSPESDWFTWFYFRRYDGLRKLIL